MLLKSTSSFDKAYRKWVRRYPHLKGQIDKTLRQLEQDLNSNSLQTHKLSGKLKSLWACSCGYDCRIIFSIETEVHTGQKFIVLVDIGTHEEVY